MGWGARGDDEGRMDGVGSEGGGEDEGRMNGVGSEAGAKQEQRRIRRNIGKGLLDVRRRGGVRKMEGGRW